MKHIGMLIGVLLLVTVPAAAPAQDEAPVYCIVDDHWDTLFSDRGVTVYAQRTPETRVLAFKAEGIIEAPIEQVMEVLRRVEIAEEWMPDIRTKYTVKDVSDMEAITYSVNILPWPFADRELLLHNSLRLDPVRKTLVVDVMSITVDDYPVQRGTVRAHMYCGETLVRPAGDGKTHLAVTVFVDPKGFVPAWLANLVQKRMPYDFLRALEKKARSTHFELRPVYRQLLDELYALLRE